MNKYELDLTLSELDKLIARHKFRQAAELADTVDWRRVKDVRTLCRVSDVYKVNRRYEDSKRILELAYAKKPGGRQIVYSLCELELKIGNQVRALQLYNEYINLAPRDTDRYVLQYKLYKAHNVSINERIAVLEEMARYDVRDKWFYELAKLYHEAGERPMCASQCDEIVAYFGEGRYVQKALELKASFCELTPAQKALYRKMTGEEENEEAPAAKDMSAAVPESERDDRKESGFADGAGEAAGNSRLREPAAAMKETIAAEPGRAEDVSADGFSDVPPDAFSDLPPEVLSDLSPDGITGKGTDASNKTDSEKKDSEKPDSEKPDSQNRDSKNWDSELSDGEKGTDARTGAGDAGPEEEPQPEVPEENREQEFIPDLNIDHSESEIPWEFEEYEISGKELRKKPATGKKAAEPSVIKRREKSGPGRQQKREPATDHSVFEDRSFEISPEESVFSQESMQRMIAKGMQGLDNYDTYLMQETDGQYAMVMQDTQKPDKQITGQLNLEDIMAEWEKVKKDFYEFNGLEEDEAGVVPSAAEPDLMPAAHDRDGSGQGTKKKKNTKSWDPQEVHEALRIRDDDEGSAGYDTSLFVTEGGGEFPEEFAVEKVSDGGKGKRETGPIYLHSEDSIRQLTAALDKIFLEGGTGNVIITGDEGVGTLSLARELVRKYRQINPNFVGQIAKSEGRYITRENTLRVIPRMPFGSLIIERASAMSEEGAASLYEMLRMPERNILIIMIDRKGVMDAFLNDHPKLRDMFPARVDIAALSVDTLLGYAREYAGKQQCEIDEYGIRALQSRVMSMQTVEHSVTLEDIRDIVDEAIYYASRKSLSSLVDSFSRRKGGAQNRIVLRDKDFLHY